MARRNDSTGERPKRSQKPLSSTEPSVPSAASRSKRRRSVEVVEPLQGGPAAASDDERRFTAGHVLAGMAVGLLLGGVGGFYARSESPPVAASSDTAVVPLSAPSGSATVAAKSPPQKRQAPPAPKGPVYVPIADWSPREGPELAKVTIMEFSDFQ